MKNQERYIRQINLQEVGVVGQDKLKNASVLVVGAGGLGCAILPYLTGAGIGTIGIIDGDTVATSNLHRQVLFTNKDVGKYKSLIASRRLKELNADVVFNVHTEYLNGKNALSLFKDYDVIVDATDRISARYLINDACVLHNKPFVHGAIYRFQSQITVFNYKNGPTYRCLYPQPDHNALSCSEVGVLGTTVAIAGAIQANEVIKIILEIGVVLSGKLLVVDSLTNEQSNFSFKKNSELQITHESFENEHQIKTKSYVFARTKKALVIDVRQADEQPKVEAKNIIKIPLSEIELSISRIPTDKSVFLFCQSGIRSKQTYALLQKHKFNNIYCLEENASELIKLI